MSLDVTTHGLRRRFSRRRLRHPRQAASMVAAIVASGVVGLHLAASAAPLRTVAAPAGGVITGLHVQGNQLLDGSNRTVQLRGAQIPGLNFKTYKDPHLAALLNPTTFKVMHDTWGMNALRLPFSGYYLAQDSTYLQRLDTVVQQANAAGLVVILAYFGDAHAGNPNASVAMPMPAAVGFWSTVAAHFSDTKRYSVMFDLYNEPHLTKPPTAADWQIWSNGGTVSGTTVVGLPALGTAIRKAGATQPLVVQGLSGLVGMPAYPDTNIVLSRHTYFEGDLTPAKWDTEFGSLASSHPIYVGEWAFLPNANYPAMCSKLNLTTQQATDLVNSFLAYMDGKGISYTAWAFNPTHLIVDTTAYTPTTIPNPMSCSQTQTTAGMGALYKAHLLSLVGGNPSPIPSTSPRPSTSPSASPSICPLVSQRATTTCGCTPIVRGRPCPVPSPSPSTSPGPSPSPTLCPAVGACGCVPPIAGRMCPGPSPAPSPSASPRPCREDAACRCDRDADQTAARRCRSDGEDERDLPDPSTSD